MITYTWTEIIKHHTYDDCWIVANNYIYDVTKYIKLHPGGIEAIIKKAGTDCTYDFNFHSTNGKNIWEKYRIGKIEKNCIIL